MAEQRKKSKKTGGPYLAAAFFCETILEDKYDNTLSAIRIIDQIIFTIDPFAPPDFPSESKKIPVPVTGLLAFRSGDSPGEHVVRLVMESPSGKLNPAADQAIQLTPQPNGGMNLRIKNTVFVIRAAFSNFTFF